LFDSQLENRAFSSQRSAGGAIYFGLSVLGLEIIERAEAAGVIVEC